MSTFNCDQYTYNYYSYIVFSRIPIEFDPTRNSAIRSADRENHILEPNMEWIGWLVVKISPWNFAKWEVGCRSVGPESHLGGKWWPVPTLNSQHAPALPLCEHWSSVDVLTWRRCHKSQVRYNADVFAMMRSLGAGDKEFMYANP